MKKNIAIMAGGDSSEWQISLESAKQIERILDRTKYEPFTINLRGRDWFYTDPNGGRHDLDRNDFSLTIDGVKITLEYALILIHGTPGEDGRLQGYLDMMGIPYSSSGFVPSVITFDKSLCKKAVAVTGVGLAKEMLIGRGESYDTAEIVKRLGLPLFVKPNASGSSFGVTKVKKEGDLPAAIEAALKESDSALLEEFIAGREISCGVMVAGGREYIFPVTELVTGREFFDYEAKYQGQAQEITPADLGSDILKKVNKYTLAIYKTLRCSGVARVDLIIRGSDVYMIEINTVPGMSSSSILPQQAAAMGMSMTELFNIIIGEF